MLPARREQHPQFRREAEPQIGERGGQHARHQYRPPADPVANPPPERSGNHRHQREDRKQERHLLRRGAKALGIERQQRDDQPEADEIDKHNEEEDGHRASLISAPTPPNKRRLPQLVIWPGAARATQKPSESSPSS
jgi:hypothetical protein